MNLTLPHSDLLAAVTTAARSAMSGHAARQRPQLACLKLTADGERLTVAATDLDRHLTLSVAATVAAPGVCLVPAAELAAWLGELPGGDVTLDAAGTTLAVAGEGGRAELPTQKPDEFPDLPFGAATYSARVEAGALALAVSRVRGACEEAAGETRFVTGHVLFDVAAEGLTLVATDSKRMSLARVPGAACAGAGSGLLPLRAAELAAGAAGPGVVLAEFGPNLVRFSPVPEGAGGVLTARLVSGRFAPWKRAMADYSRGGTTVTLKAAEFAAVVRRAAVLADKEAKRLELTFSRGTLVLATAGAGRGTASRCEMALDYDGPAVAVTVDALYLRGFAAAAKASGPEELVLRLPGKKGEHMEAVTARCGPDWDYLLMPLSD